MNAGERLPGTPAPMHLWPTDEGLHIAADAWGDPTAPLVLLGHGGGQTRHAWRATGQELGAAGYHAVAFDLRGHGDSDWPSDGVYSLDAYIGGLQSLLRVLGGRKAVLNGASMSAEIFLVAAGEGAVDAAALVLVDFAPRTQPEGYERNRTFMAAHAQGFASLEEVADAISSHRGGAPRPPNLNGLAKVVRKRSDGRYHWHWDQRMLDWRVQEYPTRYERMAAAARRLTAPTLLVRGDKSDVVSEEGAQEFMQLAPHTEYVLIADAGHMIAGDRNDTFGHAAVDFMKRALRS
jgi:pimeloyl-ACP methyl ester carboxylesterase